MKYQLKTRSPVSFTVNTSEIIERKINGETVKVYKDAAKTTTVTLRVGAGEVKASKDVIDRIIKLPIFLEMVAEGSLHIADNKELEKLYNERNEVLIERRKRMIAEQNRRKELADENADAADEVAALKAQLAEQGKALAQLQASLGGS